MGKKPKLYLIAVVAEMLGTPFAISEPASLL
jgi:hypothetical protein